MRLEREKSQITLDPVGHFQMLWEPLRSFQQRHNQQFAVLLCFGLISLATKQQWMVSIVVIFVPLFVVFFYRSICLQFQNKTSSSCNVQLFFLPALVEHYKNTNHLYNMISVCPFIYLLYFLRLYSSSELCFTWSSFSQCCYSYNMSVTFIQSVQVRPAKVKS